MYMTPVRYVLALREVVVVLLSAPTRCRFRGWYYPTLSSFSSIRKPLRMMRQASNDGDRSGRVVLARLMDW
jgi:hypothetical protein